MSEKITLKVRRRVWRAGGRSKNVVISLPHESGLKPGDEVSVTIYKNGDILIEKEGV